jgi:hypothetical protein
MMMVEFVVNELNYPARFYRETIHKDAIAKEFCVFFARTFGTPKTIIGQAFL